jgi:hypothetical protein
MGLGMAEDFHRVDVVIDGIEKRIQMSKPDLKHGLQSMWLDDMDTGWKLLESRMPGLMAAAMEKHEAEKARALQLATAEYLDRHPPQPVNPIKAFIGRNWGWVTAIAVIVGLLRPEWIKFIFVHMLGV